jgi:hypothetical protein
MNHSPHLLVSEKCDKAKARQRHDPLMNIKKQPTNTVGARQNVTQITLNNDYGNQ